MTKTEAEILQILWDSERPMCAYDIIMERPQLKEITVRTTLANMLKKDLIRVEGMVHRTKSYARAFCANVTSDELICKEILDSKSTTPFKFVKALFQGNFLTKDEQRELYEIICWRLCKK